MKLNINNPSRFLASKVLLLLLFLFIIDNSYAQNDRKLIREGNELYKQNKYSEAEIKYRKSLEENDKNSKAGYNLGASLYRQGNFEKAAEEFNSFIGKDNDKKKVAKAFHNLGNSLLQEKKYAESIEAYKQALKNNPSDKDTKYNLSYALQMMKQEQQQQQKNKDNKQDGNQDKKDQQNQDKQDQNKDNNKDQQNQEQQQEQKKQGQQQEQAAQPKEQKLSKEDAERILQALQNEEQDLQKKLKRLKPSGVKTEKNW